MRQELESFIDIIMQIRVLSAAQIPQGSTAEEYKDMLTKQYKEIGALGAKSREIMDKVIMPFLKATEPADYDTIVEFQEFCDNLLNPSSGDELDLSLLFELSKKLLETLEGSGYCDLWVRQLHMHINVCYANMNRTTRMLVSRDLCGYYREEGLAAAGELKAYLEHDRFLSLSKDARHYVMRGVRFYSALYDTFYTDEESNRLRFQALKDSVAMYYDEFFRMNIEGYDWESHLFRCIEHMGQLTERGNRWKFTVDQVREILEYLKNLERLWESFGERAEEILPRVHLELILLRNSYFAGLIDRETYQKSLSKLYDTWANSKYDMYSVQANLLIPAEYLATLDINNLTAEDVANIDKIYDTVVAYIMGSVNMDAFNYLQEYLVAVLEKFIEVPGGLTFKEMGLRCLAALHIPTYVHSLQVARLSKCILETLARCNPQILRNVREGVAWDDLPEAVFNEGLCHDFGKLTAIDTIFVYGRSLFDREFEIIKMHPAMGERMLAHFSSTARYAKGAGMHHVWYGGFGGYPAYDQEKPDLVTSIITVADCIDAATDTVGRSYSVGKSLEKVIEELKAGSGVRYCPEVVDVLDDEELLEKLDYLIHDGRTDAYASAFQLLTVGKKQ